MTTQKQTTIELYLEDPSSENPESVPLNVEQLKKVLTGLIRPDKIVASYARRINHGPNTYSHSDFFRSISLSLPDLTEVFHKRDLLIDEEKAAIISRAFTEAVLDRSRIISLRAYREVMEDAIEDAKVKRLPCTTSLENELVKFGTPEGFNPHGIYSVKPEDVGEENG